DVEDLHLGRISAARPPREVLALVTPCICPVHGPTLSHLRDGGQLWRRGLRSSVSGGARRRGGPPPSASGSSGRPCRRASAASPRGRRPLPEPGNRSARVRTR